MSKSFIWRQNASYLVTNSPSHTLLHFVEWSRTDWWRRWHVRSLMSTASLCRWLVVMYICAFPHYSLYQEILCGHFWLRLLYLRNKTEMRDPKYEIWRKRHQCIKYTATKVEKCKRIHNKKFYDINFSTRK